MSYKVKIIYMENEKKVQNCLFFASQFSGQTCKLDSKSYCTAITTNFFLTFLRSIFQITWISNPLHIFFHANQTLSRHEGINIWYTSQYVSLDLFPEIRLCTCVVCMINSMTTLLENFDGISIAIPITEGRFLPKEQIDPTKRQFNLTCNER